MVVGRPSLHDAPSDEHLLLEEQQEIPMGNLTGAHTTSEHAESRSRYTDAPAAGPSSDPSDDSAQRSSSQPIYKVYKRRWFGLAQLVLLNIIWLTFAAVSTSAADYFHVTESDINWLSTAFLFAFVVMTPLVIYTLNRGGPKPAILAASILTLVGNWIRYAGTRASEGHFGIVMFGQILIGLAQPFVLSAPTRYSDLWFTDRGRVAATAIASLANPFGGALGQLIGPLWATDSSHIPSMVLYTAILSSVASLPSFFVPSSPPTPPSPSSSVLRPTLRNSLRVLLRTPAFYAVLLPFSVYVGLFNAFSSLINQIFSPYGFSEENAGISGALLIVVGLVASAITSPIVDRTKAFLFTIKLFVPIVAAAYLAIVWIPGTRSVAGSYVVTSILGAASFSLVPVALEYLVEITFPVSPEFTSTLCWSGGQLLGAVFILIMDALKGSWRGGQPEGNMKAALVFQAVVAWAVVPCAMALGLGAFKMKGSGRLGIDKRTGTRSDSRSPVEGDVG